MATAAARASDTLGAAMRIGVTDEVAKLDVSILAGFFVQFLTRYLQGWCFRSWTPAEVESAVNQEDWRVGWAVRRASRRAWRRSKQDGRFRRCTRGVKRARIQQLERQFFDQCAVNPGMVAEVVSEARAT